jgi:hypothetical protein
MGAPVAVIPFADNGISQRRLVGAGIIGERDRMTLPITTVDAMGYHHPAEDLAILQFQQEKTLPAGMNGKIQKKDIIRVQMVFRDVLYIIPVDQIVVGERPGVLAVSLSGTRGFLSRSAVASGGGEQHMDGKKEKKEHRPHRSIFLIKKGVDQELCQLLMYELSVC